ncbi:MAG TPA: hypothetical protein VHR66_13025, partial [Gemmataceae bacterium]|nr:hypothetical protein [Gemmataceae bacterium]
MSVKSPPAKGAPATRVNLYELERSTLHDLLKLVEARAAADVAAKSANTGAISSAEKDWARARKQVAVAREQNLTALEAARVEAIQQLNERFQAETAAADLELAETKKRVTTECDEIEQKARTAYQDTRWTADSMHEAAEKSASDEREEIRRSAAKTAERINALWKEAEGPLARAALERADVEVPTSQAAGGLIVDPARTIEEQFEAAQLALGDLRDSRRLKLATPMGLIFIVVPIGILSAIPSLLVEQKIVAIIGGGVGALVIAFLVHWLLRRSALKWGAARAHDFGTALARVGEARVTLLKRADSEYVRRLTEAGSVREQTKAHAESIYRPLSEKNAARKARELTEATDKHARTTDRLRFWRVDATDKAEEHYSRAKTDSEDRYSAALSDAERRARDIGSEAKATLADAERNIAVEWRDGQDRIGRALNKLRANGLEHFPDWNSPFWYNPP